MQVTLTKWEDEHEPAIVLTDYASKHPRSLHTEDKTIFAFLQELVFEPRKTKGCKRSAPPLELVTDDYVEFDTNQETTITFPDVAGCLAFVVLPTYASNSGAFAAHLPLTCSTDSDAERWGEIKSYAQTGGHTIFWAINTHAKYGMDESLATRVLVDNFGIPLGHFQPLHCSDWESGNGLLTFTLSRREFDVDPVL